MPRRVVRNVSRWSQSPISRGATPAFPSISKLQQIGYIKVKRQWPPNTSCPWYGLTDLVGKATVPLSLLDGV